MESPKTTKLIKAARLKGFNDYLPSEALLKQKFLRIMQKQAEVCGFLSMQTPTLEYAETLLGEGGETDKQVYKFLDNGEREVALRYDLTVPFSRFVAEHFAELVLPFKRFESGQVFRAEKPQKGRYREFCQSDFDIIGVDSVLADVEVLACLGRTLSEFDIGEIEFRINNRFVLSALIKYFLPQLATDQETAVLIQLDKLDKLSVELVLQQMILIPGVDASGGKKLLDFSTQSETQDWEICLTQLRGLFIAEANATKELDRFEETLILLKNLKLPRIDFQLDLKIARGLAYYTGIVFEAQLLAIPGFGSICSGGRYNQLASRFIKQDLPGVGGSIGLDRLVSGVSELKKTELNLDCYIIVTSSHYDAFAYDALTTLRNSGLRCDINLQAQKKIAAQLRQANRLNARFAVIIGEEEFKTHSYVLKDLLQQQEFKNISLEAMLETMLDALQKPRPSPPNQKSEPTQGGNTQ
ncbi:MAG: histidine--tRNA ligase [Oligoflexales bacterium]|nr:histidine--tRNA ligase [Oligoflexales bacterium]